MAVISKPSYASGFNGQPPLFAGGVYKEDAGYKDYALSMSKLNKAMETPKADLKRRVTKNLSIAVVTIAVTVVIAVSVLAVFSLLPYAAIGALGGGAALLLILAAVKLHNSKDPSSKQFVHFAHDYKIAREVLNTYYMNESDEKKITNSINSFVKLLPKKINALHMLLDLLILSKALPNKAGEIEEVSYTLEAHLKSVKCTVSKRSINAFAGDLKAREKDFLPLIVDAADELEVIKMCINGTREEQQRVRDYIKGMFNGIMEMLKSK